MSQELQADSAGSGVQTGNAHWTARLAIKANRIKMLAKKRWWLLFVLVCLGIAIQSYILFTKPVTYESMGKMIVSGRTETQIGASFTEDVLHFYGTQIEYMQSPDVWERARRRIEMESPNLRGSASLRARQVPRAATFDLTGTGDHPEYTRAFVNAVMDEVVSFRREMRQESAGSTMVQVSEELARLRLELESRERDLAKFIEENNMSFWEEQSVTAAKFLSDLRIRRSELQKELNIMEALTPDQLLVRAAGPAAAVAGAPAAQPGEIPVADPARADASTPVMAPGDLRSQYMMARQELGQREAEANQLGKVLRPAHPKMRTIQDQIEAIENRMATIREQNIEASGAKKTSVQAELTGVEASIEEWEEANLEANIKGNQYRQLETSVNRTRDLYERVLASIENLGISANVNQDDIQVMQRATPAVERRPSVPQHLFMGLLMGLGCSVGLLLLLDRADDRITSFTEITERFALPVLGQIPAVPSKDKRKDDVALILPDDDRYMFAEAFRNLRSSLFFMPDQASLKTILVTSSIPGEGKSTIASNLGVTLASAGTRVLLVDADLRRGDISAKFGVDDRTGFTSVLMQKVAWQDAVKPTSYDNLDLMPRGTVVNNPAELLLQHALDGFLAETRERYDLVLFNSAPILATDDTTTLAPKIDGVLMVIRAFVTSTRLAENSLNAMYQRQTNVLGIILNSVNTEMADYYHYRYSQYYSKA